MYRKTLILLEQRLQFVSVQMTDIGIVYSLFKMGRALSGAWIGFCFIKRGHTAKGIYFFLCAFKYMKTFYLVIDSSHYLPFFLLYVLFGYV